MTCPTPCDTNCTERCHEVHHTWWERSHQPGTCPLQVSSDGTTVWVNGPHGSVASFGRLRITISTFSGTGYLHQISALTTTTDWDTFKAKMLEHYNIVIDERHRPRRL